MENLSNFPVLIVAGVPAITFVFGIVEFIKKMGVSGKILTVLSLVIGIVIATLVQLTEGVPANYAQWLVLVLVGLGYGLTASGVFSFIDKRTQKAP